MLPNHRGSGDNENIKSGLEMGMELADNFADNPACTVARYGFPKTFTGNGTIAIMGQSVRGEAQDHKIVTIGPPLAA